jgi:hypothetical protein
VGSTTVIGSGLKGLLLAALLLLVVVDLGAPLVVRVQMDATASDAVTASGRTWLRTSDVRAAEAVAVEEAAAGEATLEQFEILPDGRVHVTLTRRVDARIFDRVEQLATWFDVRVDLTSPGTVL